MLSDLLPPALVALLLDSILQTATMVGVAALLSTLVGLPLGVLLVVTSKGQFLDRPALNRVIGTVVNLIRSTPFIILMVAIIPLTRLLAGTTVGTAAAIVPLTIAITPLYARLAEAAMREVDQSLIEAAQAMGATPLQIILKVLLPEALPGILAGQTVTLVSLVGYSAMAGTVGGGGLGDLGIRFGYQRFMPEVMVAVVIVLVVIVQSIQMAGDWAARTVNHRVARSRDRA
ncbi:MULTISPECIES: methionine ABC transporter permease [unclassified Rhizobium]|uniref:methionine ABC transporter permease n=1 Tax=unclassified Rhizobium TaxID=2613769 RepID=UPI000712E7CE|nr:MULTISPECIES: methionine ABC transporter permease [unclassified Rhizobium]KQS89454.1 DL-methionine transporter permease subunit [Rhizobium sp. Leaf391]KQS94733.1 DL-methionine transporter permease subunit [Rhizobium sp. Leaf386]KQU01111.1 DL-methionine transporter permease subunit [Rhizobium sp. Leaf453]